MNNYLGLVISDIHVGAFDSDKLYKEWKDIFISYIIKSIDSHRKIDFIVICGDFFDHKFYLNDKDAILAYRMLYELISITESMNTQIRIVYGTESHEVNQYELIPFLSNEKRIKVIKHVEEEEIFPGFNFLYLPEEFIEDKESYYKEYFSKTNFYDYIFGHGVLKEVVSSNMIIHLDKKSKRKSIPIFNSNELGNICKGQVFFGHFHIRKIIKDKFFSVGSFSRYQFGQEEEKGFYEISYNKTDNTYDFKFIENTLADTYKTINFGYNHKIFNNEKSFEEEFNKIESVLDKGLLDHVRFEINIPKEVKSPEGIINQLKEKFKYKDNIKIDIVNGYIEEKKEVKKKEIEKENSLYAFLFKEIPIEEKVEMFINIEYHKDLEKEKIKKYFINEIKDME